MSRAGIASLMTESLSREPGSGPLQELREIASDDQVIDADFHTRLTPCVEKAWLRVEPVANAPVNGILLAPLPLQTLETVVPAVRRALRSPPAHVPPSLNPKLRLTAAGLLDHAANPTLSPADWIARIAPMIRVASLELHLRDSSTAPALRVPLTPVDLVPFADLIRADLRDAALKTLGDRHPG